MPWYETSYLPNGAPLLARIPTHGLNTYRGSLWARNMRMAKRTARLRGIGESILGELKFSDRPASVMVMRRRGPKLDQRTLHALCYLAMVALSAGTTTIMAAVGDEGFLHHWAHLRQFGYIVGPTARLRGSKAREFLRDMLRDVERRTPGFVEAA